MIESILNPRRSERRPWEMIVIGFIYSSLSVLLVTWIFSRDVALAKYSGIFIVTFTVMFCIPFFYYMLKIEEEKEDRNFGVIGLLKEHGKAVHSLLWMFMGFILGFSIFYILIGSPENFRAQIETFCLINSPNNYNACLSQHGLTGAITGLAGSGIELFGGIFSNNLYVLIFTVIFSIIFGAGGIFVLAWNATVISAAVVLFANSDLAKLPLALSRYLIHGIPEIAAYFVGTLAGGIIGLSIIRKEFRTEKFWGVLQDCLLLIIIAIIILVIAAWIEVFVTPRIF